VCHGTGYIRHLIKKERCRACKGKGRMRCATCVGTAIIQTKDIEYNISVEGTNAEEVQQVMTSLVAETAVNLSRENNKVKILFLSASPIDTARLRLDEEVKRVQNTLKLAKERDNLNFVHASAVTIDSLMQTILDESPTIVHFSGHGKQSGIILQDEVGGSKLVTTAAITSLFKLFKDIVKCVILNACYSEDQACAIKLHIPYVIGMRTEISDKTAISFSTGFYKAIGAGKDIPFAFDLGKTAIQLDGFSGDDIPILL
jgi:hypothetical protein